MIFVTKIDNHKEINKNLLKLISEINNPYRDKEGSIISNTDWTLPKEFKRNYLTYFFEIINPYMDEISLKFNSKNWIIHNCWFQQYLKSNTHVWHTHHSSHFTNVYFVELPDKYLVTEIYEHKKLNVKEGDLLTFPAYLFHRSPINKLNKRKTIISFNSSIDKFIKE